MYQYFSFQTLYSFPRVKDPIDERRCRRHAYVHARFIARKRLREIEFMRRQDSRVRL